MIHLADGAPDRFDWQRWPETETWIDDLIVTGLSGNALAGELAERMNRETSTRFQDWVDHLVVTYFADQLEHLERIGYRQDSDLGTHGSIVYRHDGGMFPKIVVAGGSGATVAEIAIKVDSVVDFSRAHDLGLEIQGYPLGPYRIARVPGVATTLAIVERRGYAGFEPYSGVLSRGGRMAPHAARDALAARDLWTGRRRRFAEDEEGFDATDELLERVIELCHGSEDLACDLVFEAERAYWQLRNRAARVQKARQDRLGLGWANHDHHTFRCSRRFFPRVMNVFRRLGFAMRERFHAGEHAGWGAQVLEHPTTGIVIFADLDLAPDEAGRDFTHESLPDLPRPNTVGLWVGLHGESLLEAGMHHLEAQFDFDRLREDLLAEAQVASMKPFSDFPFLRQAFTEAERWPIQRARADRLLGLGWIDPAQHERFLAEGAVGSHLENLQRREGFKGFNQQAVGAVIAATDPRR